jgi:hypothetical protein
MLVFPSVFASIIDFIDLCRLGFWLRRRELLGNYRNEARCFGHRLNLHRGAVLIRDRWRESAQRNDSVRMWEFIRNEGRVKASTDA